MKVRNCFSLADGTLVSGKELWEFFHNSDPYTLGHAGRHLMKYFQMRFDCQEWFIDENATYVVEHRPWSGAGFGSKKKIWFRKLPGLGKS